MLYVVTSGDDYGDDDDSVFNKRPDRKTLTRIQGFFETKWECIGYHLLPDNEIEGIKCHTGKNDNQKCFDMLCRWLEVDTGATYTALFKALKIFKLNRAVENVKKTILENELQQV